jgi:hypothetical protein
MSRSENAGIGVTFIGAHGPIDTESAELPPAVRAKMMRLLSGQRSALKAIDVDEMPAHQRTNIESASRETQERLDAMGDTRGE